MSEIEIKLKCIELTKDNLGADLSKAKQAFEWLMSSTPSIQQ